MPTAPTTNKSSDGTSRCVWTAGLPQRMQMASNFVISSATASNRGMGSKGRPRKSVSRPATMTLLPKSAKRVQTPIRPSPRNWASSIPTTSVRGFSFSRISSALATGSEGIPSPECDTISKRIPLVNDRLENLHSLPCNLGTAETPNQLLAFAGKHGPDNDLDPPHIAAHNVHGRPPLTPLPQG